MPGPLRFGDFELDPAGELRRSGVPVKLAPQPLRVLALLAARPGQVVSREEIRREIWGDVHVDFELGLNSCIKQVRHAVGADYIETIPKRGYRFKSNLVTTKTQRTQRRPWTWAAASVGAVFLCVLCVFVVHFAFQRQVPPRERVLLAVLPFDDLTPSQDYFSDGLTEEMITQLSRLQPDRLGIIGRASAMQYKKTRKSIPEIGRELGVDYILQGSVRQDAGKVRISAQLVKVGDQTQRWAETYEREAGGALAMESRVARQIARSLAGELLPGSGQVALAASRAATTNDAAFAAYMRGQHAMGQRTDRGFQLAIENFSRATREDPGYALAYAGLADTYSLMGEYYVLPPKDAFPRARDAARRALEIDDSLAEAQTSLALVMAKYEWDWPGAEARFRRAIELDAGYATAHQWYAELLSAEGRHEQAITEIERARQLDPLSLIIQSVDGYIYYNARRYDEAIAQCRAVLKRDPRFLPALEFLMLAYERKGMDAETLALERVAAEEAIQGVRSVRFLAESVSEPHLDSSPYSVAARYAVLGRRDLAFRWLDRAAERHDALLTFAKVDPNLDALREDPRFPGLLKRLRLSR
jgi:TolB-like protein/DNA-binding winged helix-turn-helix (wHTH) protein/tetratricopeptide (TPR) repeat protein